MYREIYSLRQVKIVIFVEQLNKFIMKGRLFLVGLMALLLTSKVSFSAEGDTTIVTSHDKQHMKFPPGNRRYTNVAVFPDGSTTFRKVILNYTLGCPPGGCSEWDYTTKVDVMRPTGTFDSSLTRYPYFRVDGAIRDSMHISFDTTFVTFYNATTMTTDSLPSDTVLFHLYKDSSMPSFATDSFYAYETGYYKYYYNAAGTIIDSSYVSGDSTWYQTYYDVYTKFEVKERIELARLITPYLGSYYPYTYSFDITDFTPLLQDSTEIALDFGGWQDGFLGTLDFIFIEGTPPRKAKRVIGVYHGSYNYGVAANPINDQLDLFSFTLNSDEVASQLNFTPTGHGFGGNENCAEFCRKEYQVKINGTQQYAKEIWREDCGENPLYPQGGTWIYDRSNWCPGLPGDRHTHELTPHVTTGSNTLEIDFQNYTWNGGGSTPVYILDASLVTFGPPSFSLDASIEEIIAPNNNKLLSRHNPICGRPVVRIKNTGSTTLTSLDIHYGHQGGELGTYTWTGSLGFLETEVVEMPFRNWNGWVEGQPYVYEVSISSPNGGQDEYAENNTLTSSFDLPDKLPSEFVIWLRATRSTENSYTISDDLGKVIHSGSGFSNNTQHYDTVQLADGCYEFEIKDSQKDGLGFFANGTSGNLFIRSASPPVRSLKTFEASFGTSIRYQFTVGHTLTTSVNHVEKAMPLEMNLFPNPTHGTVELTLFGASQDPITVQVLDLLGHEVYRKTHVATQGQLNTTIRLAENKGLFMVVVQSAKHHEVRRLLVH
jgi:hypothetical protein